MSENQIGSTCSASAPMGQIELIIRFEDLNRDNGGFYDDFNDLIVSRDIGTATARQMGAKSIASNIDLADVDRRTRQCDDHDPHGLSGRQHGRLAKWHPKWQRNIGHSNRI